MIDADIQKAIKSILDTGLPAAGIANAVIAQSYNPTTQGPPLAPVVLFTKIFSRRYGTQGRKYVYNPGSGDFTKTETWYVADTYQINSLMNQDPVDDSSLNAYDVVGTCAGILQTSETRQTLLAQGIGIRRITDLQTPGSLDDSDRYNMDVSFDFVLTYQNTLASIVAEAGVDGIVTAV